MVSSGQWRTAQVEDRPQTLPGEVVRSVPTPNRTSQYDGFLPDRSPPATEGNLRTLSCGRIEGGVGDLAVDELLASPQKTQRSAMPNRGLRSSRATYPP